MKLLLALALVGAVAAKKGGLPALNVNGPVNSYTGPSGGAWFATPASSVWSKGSHPQYPDHAAVINKSVDLGLKEANGAARSVAIEGEKGSLVVETRLEIGPKLCDKTQHVVAPPTETRDTQCRDNVVCDASEYETSPRTADRDRTCAPITLCSGGTFEIVAPTKTSNRVCGTSSPTPKPTPAPTPKKLIGQWSNWGPWSSCDGGSAGSAGTVRRCEATPFWRNAVPDKSKGWHFETDASSTAMDKWCMHNCNGNPPNCPKTHCVCDSTPVCKLGGDAAHCSCEQKTRVRRCTFEGHDKVMTTMAIGEEDGSGDGTHGVGTATTLALGEESDVYYNMAASFRRLGEVGDYVNGVHVHRTACKGPDREHAACPKPTCGAGRFVSGHCCEACSPGRYGAGGVCKDCPAGQHQDEEGGAACKACQAGRFQPSTGQPTCQHVPCCGDGQQPLFAADRTSAKCVPCPAGRHKSGKGCTDVCTDCEAGRFQPATGKSTCDCADFGRAVTDTGRSKEQECSPGKYQDKLCQSQCKECAAGQWQKEWGASDCGAHTCCPAGQEGEHTSVKSQCSLCAVGYAKPGWVDGKENCDGRCAACGPGKYANREGGATACASCAAGTYSAAVANAACGLCPAGQYQPEAGNSVCKDVSPGHWSSIGASTQRPWRRCPAGKYGVHGSATSSGTCQDCAAGTFKAAEGPYEAQCLKCEPGRYQPATGRDECTLCSIGQYQDTRAATGCKSCSAGRYGSVTGAASMSDCPSCALGSYNEEEGRAKPCTPCENGRRGHAGQSPANHKQHCRACTPGRFFHQAMITSHGATHVNGECVKCSAGQYQHKPQQATCHSCLVKNSPWTEGDLGGGKIYWTKNEPGWKNCVCKPLNCKFKAFGKWGTCTKSCGGGRQTRTRSVANEAWCGGTACEDLENGAPWAFDAKDRVWRHERDCNLHACPIDCVPNNWNLHPWGTCDLSCNTGHRTRTREIRVKAQFGGRACEKQHGTELRQVESCNKHKCPFDCVFNAWSVWGFRGVGGACSESCGTGEQHRTRTIAQAAKYGGAVCAPLSGTRLCNTQCCKGTFHTDPSGDITKCTVCPVGQFAAGEGAHTCVACPVGQYQAYEGSHKCVKCPVGTYNPSKGKTSLEKHCQHCAPGKYQDNDGSHACIDCAAGRFNARNKSAHAHHCQACAPGRFQTSKGSTECIDCEVGEYQDVQGSSKCKECRGGRYQPQLARPSELYCLSCTCGKWSVKGSSICSACAAGRFRTNVEGNGPMSCSAATLGQQPELNNRQVACSQKACPAGRYQDEAGQPNCKACPKGTFNMNTGSMASSACLDCKPGRWAGQGAPRCTACEAGRVSNVKALATKAGCGACQAGHYAASAAMTACIACETGRFATTEAATQCRKCPQGTANGNTAATSSSACVACAAGQFQPAMDSAKCKSCTFGTYQDEQGQIDCKMCARGYANGATGSTRADACVACKVGHYAHVVGTKTCSKCAEGRASSVVTATTPSACVHCAAGQYADRKGMAVCKSCAAGKFGQSHHIGAKDEMLHCLHCPAGKFQEADGYTKCFECKSGKFTAPAASKVRCEDCEVVDAVRKYDTKGLAGQKQCWPVPVDCVEGPWTAFDTCTRSCGTGQYTRTRRPLRQPAAPGRCGLGSEHACTQAWGGGIACSERTWSNTQNCNRHACPVDCVVSTWSHWTGCSQFCSADGKTAGFTERVRVQHVAAAYGGKQCPHMHEKRPCNMHACELESRHDHAPSQCNSKHVHCKVEPIAHHNSLQRRKYLPLCAKSDGMNGRPVQEEAACWNNIGGCKPSKYDANLDYSGWCHLPDSDAERALGEHLGLGKKIDTIEVHHDGRKITGKFHCMRRGGKDSKKCSCVCDQHMPCCSHQGHVLQDVHHLVHGVTAGKSLVGNRYDDVTTLQGCCNLCRNHPSCTAWEFAKPGYGGSDQTCVLQSGSYGFEKNPQQNVRETWAGTAEDAPCSSKPQQLPQSELAKQAAAEKKAKKVAEEELIKAHRDHAGVQGHESAAKLAASSICKAVRAKEARLIRQREQDRQQLRSEMNTKIMALRKAHAACFSQQAAKK